MRDNGLTTRAAVAQNQTLMKWKWYLQERGGIAAGDVRDISKQLAGLATFTSTWPEEENPVLQSSPIQEAPPFESLSEDMKVSAWITDGSAIVALSGRKWTAAAYNPGTDTVLQETGIGGSSQYAELKAVVMTLQEDPSSHVTIYTDSWAVFWMPTWKSNEWMIHGKVVWGGKEVWDYIWKEAHSRTIKVGHVDAHVPLVPDFENYNRVADEIAKVKAVVPIDPVLMNLANWAHKQSGHLGQKATYEWAQQRGLCIKIIAALKSSKMKLKSGRNPITKYIVQM